MHREGIIKLADHKGYSFGYHFPDDDPPGWCWGVPLKSTIRGQFNVDAFWVDFTKTGEKSKAQNQVKIHAGKLGKYKEHWLVLVPKPQPKATEPA